MASEEKQFLIAYYDSGASLGCLSEIQTHLQAMPGVQWKQETQIRELAALFSASGMGTDG